MGKKASRVAMRLWVCASILALAVGRAAADPMSCQQKLAQCLGTVAALFNTATNGPVFTASLEVTGGSGAPRELMGRRFSLALGAPDFFRVSGEIEGRALEVGRRGQELWVWAAGQRFGVVGVPGLPRFEAKPNDLDTTSLPPLRLPLPAAQVALLPFLCQCDELPGATVDGASCRVVKSRLQPDAQKALGVSDFALTLWIRDVDALPARIEFQEPGGPDIIVAVHEPHIEAAWPDRRWRLDAPPGARVERVALGTLTRFFPALWEVLNTHVSPLGPATGERRVVATHGQGRLELRDGAQVLFLKGTAEEMGDQHGALLAAEVRDLVQRLLYGVGVGSSFEKGRWFLGEIEACQGRIAKFIDPAYLREMDALAASARVDPQEVRLANFFPELFHCSGFALMGRATVGGRIFHGRVLDYLRGVGLENHAVVIVHQPALRHAWVNISYAGFVGTVTAMNERHLSIGEMGGRGEGRWDGKPMAELLRDVMEQAGSLDEAIDILRRGPRTCEYYYVIADGRSKTAVGVAATPTTFELVRPGQWHSRLPHPQADTVMMSAGDRYEELSRRVAAGYGRFTAESARELMSRPVCMTSNIHSVLFAPDTLDFWVANADSEHVASAARYTRYNLDELLHGDAAKLEAKAK